MGSSFPPGSIHVGFSKLIEKIRLLFSDLIFSLVTPPGLAITRGKRKILITSSMSRMQWQTPLINSLLLTKIFVLII